MITLAAISDNDVTWSERPESSLRRREELIAAVETVLPDAIRKTQPYDDDQVGDGVSSRGGGLNRVFRNTQPEPDRATVVTQPAETTDDIYVGNESNAVNDVSSHDNKTAVQDGQLLDAYVGQISSVEDEWANVVLEGEDGERFIGRRRLAEFEELGLRCGDYFSCKTISGPNGVRVEIGLPTHHEVDAALIEQFRRDLEELGPEIG